MTIKIKVICDEIDCRNSCEIEDTFDSDINRNGYHVHPLDGYMHFCEECWPKVKEQIEAED